MYTKITEVKPVIVKKCIHHVVKVTHLIFHDFRTNHACRYACTVFSIGSHVARVSNEPRHLATGKQLPRRASHTKRQNEYSTGHAAAHVDSSVVLQ
jgi:hypothetical protein